MNRIFTAFNFLGVIVLAVLCALQWQVNSQVNLRANQFELKTQQQKVELEKDEQTIRTYTADLEDFRQRLDLSEKQLKELDRKLARETKEKNNVIAERDQLKTSLSKWIGAIADRDKTITEARDRLNKSASDHNDLVQKYNDLAAKYTVLVNQWNAQQAAR